MQKLALVLIVILAAAACDDSSPTTPSPMPDPGDPSPSPSTPTFSQVQSQVFNASCVMHHGSVAQAGLDLRSPQSHGNLVNVPSTTGVPYVVPGNPDGSYLVHKIEGRASITGVRMPQGGPPLDDDLIALVRDWIEAGAAND